jgi:dGTPase
LDSLKNENEILLKYLLENNYAYLSTICDYIAGMSDNYAKKEYEELYLVD